MRTTNVYFHNVFAGVLIEEIKGKKYSFEYDQNYNGPAISHTMPCSQKRFDYSTFPPFFDGLLPEGVQLEGLLKISKIDRDDLFSQLVAVGDDLVGAVTIKKGNL